VELLEDVRPSVRERALTALGSVAEPGDTVASTAASGCLTDANSDVRRAAEKASARLARPIQTQEVAGFAFPTPSAIEGVKSKKAALVRVMESMVFGEDGSTASGTVRRESGPAVCLSSRILLAGPTEATNSAAAAVLAGKHGSTWRHSGAHIVLITRNTVRRLLKEHADICSVVYLSGIACAAVPSASPQPAAPSAAVQGGAAIEVHLARFGLEAAAAHVPIAALPEASRARLALAAAFWPQAPHALVLDEPCGWGLCRAGQRALMRALEAYQGGVVLATCDTQLADCFVGERWVVVKGDLLKC